METTIETPTVSAPDADADMKALETEVYSPERKPVSLQVPEEAESEQKSAEKTSETRAPDEIGKEKAVKPTERSSETEPETEKTEKGEAKSEKPPEKPDSAYVKAKKDADRLGKTWEQVNREKEEVRAEKERLTQEREELNRARQPQNAEVRFKLPSSEYAEAAKGFEADFEKALRDGDTEEATKSLDLSKKAWAAANEVFEREQAQGQQQQRDQFMQTWKGHMEQVIKDKPAYGEAGTPEMVAVDKLLETYPILTYLEDGFAKAVEIAELNVKADSVSELRTELEKKDAEIQRLNGLLGISGSPPAGQPKGEVDLSSMPTDKAMERLGELAEAADAAGVRTIQ